MRYKKLVALCLIGLLSFSSLILVPCSIIEAEVDVTPPVITSLTLSKSVVTLGDTFTVKVKATDSESGFTNADSIFKSAIIFRHTIYENIQLDCMSVLTYNAATDEFLGSIVIADDAINGKYKCEVQIYDRMFNQSTKNFNDKIITITGGFDDRDPPVIESFTISKTNVKPGDTVKITVKAKDTDSGLESTRYRSSLCFVDDKYPTVQAKLSDGLDRVHLSYLSDGVYEGSFIVSNGAWNGTYTPHLEICDKAGNSTDKEYLNYKVTVTGGVDPYFLPELSKVEFSGTEFYPKDTIKISIVPSPISLDYDDIVVDVSFESVTYRSFTNYDLLQGARLRFDRDSKKFVGNFKIPVNIPNSLYYISAVAQDSKYNYISNSFPDDRFLVKSLITYDKEPVPLNGTFDPMKSVVAKSPYEGDLTSKITYAGEIDTTKTGINLYKYEVVGKDGDLYEDFRWVMVSDNYYSMANGTLYTNNNLDILVSEDTEKEVVVSNSDDKIIANNDDITLKESGFYNIKLIDNAPLLTSKKSITTTGNLSDVLMPTYATTETDNSYINLRVAIDRDPANIWGVYEGQRIRGAVSPSAEEPDCIATLNGKKHVLGTKISTPGKYLLKVIDRAGNISKVNFMILGANGEIVNNDNYEGSETSNGVETVSPGDNTSEFESSSNSYSPGDIIENTTKNTVAKASGKSVINIAMVILIPLFIFFLLGVGIVVVIIYTKNKTAKTNIN